MRDDRDPDPRQIRVFYGAVLPLFALAAGGVVWRRTGSVPGAVALAAVLGVVAATGLFYPAWGRGFYRGVRGILEPVAQVVSLILLSLVFFGVVTPIAVVLRAMGRDRLGRQTPRDAAASHWQDVTRERPLASYFRQF